jgi:hypothetical protein
MASIYIRDVDQEFYWKLKDAAHGARKSFKQHILDVLATSIAAEIPEPDYGKEPRNGPVGPALKSKRTK